MIKTTLLGASLLFSSLSFAAVDLNGSWDCAALISGQGQNIQVEGTVTFDLAAGTEVTEANTVMWQDLAPSMKIAFDVAYNASLSMEGMSMTNEIKEVTHLAYAANNTMPLGQAMLEQIKLGMIQEGKTTTEIVEIDNNAIQIVEQTELGKAVSNCTRA